MPKQIKIPAGYSSKIPYKVKLPKNFGKMKDETKIPMGLSAWKNMGREYGFWAYFAEEVKNEERQRIVEKIEGMKKAEIPANSEEFTDEELERVVSFIAGSNAIIDDLIKSI